jgi:hypothetical protein
MDGMLNPINPIVPSQKAASGPLTFPRETARLVPPLRSDPIGRRLTECRTTGET